MTLLEYLKHTKPRFYKSGVRYEEIYELIKENFEEISQARSLGYSMSQISKALKELWADKVDWSSIRWPRENNIIECYFNKIRKENNK